MPRRRPLATVLIAALTALAACRAPAAGPGSFEAREADALVERAAEHLAAERWAEAAETGRAALDAAGRADHPRAEAAALRVLGTVARDLDAIAAAEALSAELDDDDGRSRADLARARVLTALGRTDEATAAARVGLERLGVDDVLDHAELLARLHHAEAAALRAAGRPDEAAAAERRADLTLSTLADDASLPLRLDVALALASDADAPDVAFRHHARASWYARRIDQPYAELRAVVGMAGDCLALGRRHDAAAMIERALRLAVTLDPPSPGSVDVLEHHLRRHLLALDDGPGSVRWERLDALLDDHAGRLAR